MNKSQKATKTPRKSSPIQTMTVNGGQLQIGNPGNAGGTGRPPSAIRATAAIAFDKRIPILNSIADNKESRDGDRIQAVKTLAWVGLSENNVPKSKVLALIGTWREILGKHSVPETLMSELGAATRDWEIKL